MNTQLQVRSKHLRQSIPTQSLENGILASYTFSRLYVGAAKRSVGILNRLETRCLSSS